MSFRKVEIDGFSWYVAADIARALGQRDANSFASRLPAEQVRLAPIATTGGIQRMLMLSETGVAWLLGRGRQVRAIDVATALGIELRWTLAIEIECLRVLIAATKHLAPREQFLVGIHRIDLYYSTLRLAVECDEPYVHAGARKVASDEDRERAITLALGCTFLRFNPMEPDFNIGDIIALVLKRERRYDKRRSAAWRQLPNDT